MQSVLIKTNFGFAPIQDFNKPRTDAELYAKYDLTEDEITFIELMIKPMKCKHSTNTPLSYTKLNVFYKFGQFSTFGLKANYWI